MIISKGQGYVILKPDTTPKVKENIIIQIITTIISYSQMITSILSSSQMITSVLASSQIITQHVIIQPDHTVTII
jgi:hypothetical protein